MSGPSGQGVSFEDKLWLIGAAVLAVSLGIVDPGGIATSALTWLVEHDVLVPRADALVPLIGNSGLDLRRVVALVAVLVLVLLVGLGRSRRAKAAAARPAAGPAVGPPAGRF